MSAYCINSAAIHRGAVPKAEAEGRPVLTTAHVALLRRTADG